MSQTFAEVLLLVPTALSVGFVLFVSSVLQKIMNRMEEAAFKNFLTELVNHALSSPYAIIVSSITFVGMIPYWYFYGLSNGWFSAGLVMYIVTSSVSKYTTLPIYSKVTGKQFPGYKKVSVIKSTETKKLREERRKLHLANNLRGALSFATIVLMTIGLA